MSGGEDLHRLEIVAVEDWVGFAAELLAAGIRDAIDRRDQCLVAISGGSTPGPVFELLATKPLRWDRVVLLQADERLVEPGSERRNLGPQREAFAGLPVTWIPLPVDAVLAADDGATVEDALDNFVDQLETLAERPPVIDIAQLGLGDDGHTASLFAGDPALEELRRPVALTDEQLGNHRITLTRSLFDRARSVIWLVRGENKAPALGRLLAGDLTLPAGLLRPAHSVIVADTSAARQA